MPLSCLVTPNGATGHQGNNLADATVTWGNSFEDAMRDAEDAKMTEIVYSSFNIEEVLLDLGRH
jgi:hypothetical protein